MLISTGIRGNRENHKLFINSNINKVIGATKEYDYLIMKASKNEWFSDKENVVGWIEHHPDRNVIFARRSIFEERLNNVGFFL